MIVGAICCFCGRINKVKQVLRCYLNQDYEGKSYFLMYNNSPVPFELDNFPIPENKCVMLINRHIDTVTGEEYTNTGAIFRDALSFIPKECKIITHMDSDDIFLPNHLTNGVRGMTLAYHQNKLAYKPDKSYFLYAENDMVRVGNNMEPSIFIDSTFLRDRNYALEVDPYHQKWLNWLVEHNKILVEDKEDNSTFIYNWEANHGTHKLSGGGNSEKNFKAHRRFSIDFGDRILTPSLQYEVQYYYNLVKQYNERAKNNNMPATRP